MPASLLQTPLVPLHRISTTAHARKRWWRAGGRGGVKQVSKGEERTKGRVVEQSRAGAECGTV